MKEFDDLVDIISRLRKECPWDREQTHESLAKHLIEEAYELLDALAAIQTNPENHNMLNEELGDLLLQILLHSKIAIQLNKSTQRFIERAKYVEKNADPSIAIETLWEEAKKSQL